MERSRVVVISDKRAVRYQSLVEQVGKELLTLSGKKEGSFFVYLVGTAYMDKNVLSFPHTKGVPRPDMPGEFLGEIYLNPFYIKRHNEDLVYMLIHGFLHLLGYDHIRAHDRIVMEKKEDQLLKKLDALLFKHL